jgi:hypothetical protein
METRKDCLKEELVPGPWIALVIPQSLKVLTPMQIEEVRQDHARLHVIAGTQ